MYITVNIVVRDTWKVKESGGVVSVKAAQVTSGVMCGRISA